MSKNNRKASIGLVENWKKNLISYYTEGKRRKKKEERKRKKTEHRFSTRFNQFPSFNHLPSTSRLLEMTRWNWSEGNFFERWPENNRLSFPGFQSNASQRYTHCILKVFEWSEINFRDRETNFPRAASTMVYFHGRMAEARTTRILYEGWGSERERKRDRERGRFSVQDDTQSLLPSRWCVIFGACVSYVTQAGNDASRYIYPSCCFLVHEEGARRRGWKFVGSRRLWFTKFSTVLRG